MRVCECGDSLFDRDMLMSAVRQDIGPLRSERIYCASPDAGLWRPVPGDFFHAEFGDACDQFHGHGFGEREADGAFVDLVWCKIVFERRYEAAASGVERVVVLPAGEIQHGFTVQFVRGYPVRDSFLGCGQGVADGSSHALEYGLHGLGLGGDVLVHGVEFGLGHCDFSLLT